MKVKYFLSGLFFALAAMTITSCDTDRDDNPILNTDNMTTDFKLNKPAYADQLIDLATSSTVNFTWSQPNYGITLATIYSFQISLSENFTDAVLDAEGTETTPASYADLSGSFVTVIGDDSGWATVHPLRSAVEDDAFTGVYTGFAYLNTEFKFRSHEDSWDAPDWGAGADAGTIEAQAGNITVPAPGFYKMVVDMENMTYALTPISTIGVVGPAQEGGWDSDTDMTYNIETGAWEVEMNLAADELKFRANDDWAINWGGDPTDLTQDGPNIAIDAAGKYKIQLFIKYDGAHSVVFTKL